MDHLSPQQRHKNMAAIRGKNTKPEMIVRRGLWSRGFRYRLNHRGLPGHPDLVLRKYRTCIFVNGCFWHGHKLTESTVQGSGFMVQGSECCKIPKTNREFWVAKIVRNKERDKEVQRQLAQMGWHCITVWECELRPSKRQSRGSFLLKILKAVTNFLLFTILFSLKFVSLPSETKYYYYEHND